MIHFNLINYFVSHVILPKELPYKTSDNDVENEDSLIDLIYGSLILVFNGENTAEFRELLRIFEKWKCLQYKKKVIKFYLLLFIQLEKYRVIFLF